jgi:hypothetical protein
LTLTCGITMSAQKFSSPCSTAASRRPKLWPKALSGQRRNLQMASCRLLRTMTNRISTKNGTGEPWSWLRLLPHATMKAPDRSDVLSWALPVLQAAAAEKDKEYPGNDQIQYNATAICALGFAVLYLRDQDVITRDAILRLVSHQHPAVLKALGRHLPDFARLDSRLPRALVRVVMASSVHPYRGDSDHQNQLISRRTGK